MNRIEKFVYDYLKKYPSLKIKVRNIYMDILDILPDKESFFDGKLTVREGYFFGFHDITPFSIDDNLILSNKLMINLRMPNPGDPLEVGFWKKDLNDFTPIAKSYAWNYHKGCRLQWIGRNNHLIFNSSSKNKLISSIYNISSKKVDEIESPIDSISNDGKYASTFSYRRLEELMPGYGYKIDDKSFLFNKAPSKTGLFLIDINTKSKSLIHNLENLTQVESSKSMVDARHFVTHTLFSPDGTKIAFLHRWIHNDVAKRFSRLIISNIDGTKINILETDEMVSHYVWDRHSNVIVYCRKNNIDGHYIFYKNDYSKYKLINNKILNSDGHQHPFANGNSFVTDTYPNQRRYSKLYIVNHESGYVKEIASVKSPKKFQTRTLYKHWGCDLHPRVSRKGNIISFDSVHTGIRALCNLKLKK